jgi:hypothetical protein
MKPFLTLLRDSASFPSPFGFRNRLGNTLITRACGVYNFLFKPLGTWDMGLGTWDLEVLVA